MPYPNFHAFRLIQPSQFIDGSIKALDVGKGIQIYTGRLKSTGKSARQSIHFDKNKWTFSEAKEWIKDHNFKPIIQEKATG